MTSGKADAISADNFNFLRLLAAWLVLFSHAYHLTGAAAAEPLLVLTSGKMTLGTLAVGMFFSISGYLITGSAYARSSLRSFLSARFRRIFPGLAVVVALSALALGPLMTSLNFTEYFSNTLVLTYVLRNLSLFHLQYGLPGVFDATPYGAVVNGSLWSLPIEFALYLATGASVVALRVLGWLRRPLIPLLAIAVTSLTCWYLVLQGSTSGAALLIPYFMLGSAFRLSQRGLALQGAIAASLLVAVMLGLLANWKVFPVLACCAISYCTLWLAGHRTWIVPFNAERIGDLSYGIYLFAFPVQQTILALGLAHTPEMLTLVATLLVLPLAWATWHGIERRFVLARSAIDTATSVADRAASPPEAWRRIASLSLARAYGLLLSLVTLFISARLLGPEGRGEFAAAMAWAALFATLFNLSLGQALQHRLQSAVVKPTLAQQVGTLGALAGALSGIALLSAVALYAASGNTLFKGIGIWSLTIAFFGVPLLVWEQYASNLLAATAQTGLLNRAQYWGRSAGFAVFLLFVSILGWGVTGALASQFGGQLLVGIILALSLWRLAGGAVSLSGREVMPLLRSGVLIHLTTVAAFLLDQVSILLINHYLAKQSVGFYQLAQQMVGLLLIIPQSALLVIYGGLAGSNANAIWPRQRRLALYVLGGMAGLTLLSWLLAPIIVGVIAGHAFQASVTMFRALLPTLLGLSLSLIMTPQWIGRGFLKLNTFLTITTSAVVVGASVWAIPRYGVDGAIKVRLVVYALWVPLAQGVFWIWCNRCVRDSSEAQSDDAKVGSF
jgi:enterobacterial common antigen flippase